jgi:hypothetical protein
VTPEQFFAEALPWARQAHAATGVYTSVILAQWAVETGFGGPDWSPNNNPGNVGSFDGKPVATFPTLAEGVDAYIQTMKLGYYDAVRAAPTPFTQAFRLGESPWASGHYGIPPGSDLTAIMDDYHLYQYDQTQSPPEVLSMLPYDPAFAVRYLYRFALCREVDSAGFAANVAFLEGGGTLNQLLTNLQDSAEGQGVIAAQRKAWGIS